MKKLIFTSLALSMLLVSLIAPHGVMAATYYQSTIDQNQNQITYLYSVIAQLQAQLNTLLQQRNLVNYPVISNYTNNLYSYSSVNSVVSTGGVNMQNGNSVELEGSVYLQNNRSSHVWFEYGTNSAFLNYSSLSVAIDGYNNSSRSFTAVIPDLNNGTTYYYRAVVEDNTGRITEGEIKSFTYTGNNYYNNNYNHNKDYNYNYNNNYNYDWSLDINSSRYYVGDSVRVDYRIPNDYRNDNNWIGLYRVGDSNNNYQSRQYLDNNENEGYLNFRVNDNDDYEFRIFRDSTNNKMATSNTFRVTN